MEKKLWRFRNLEEKLEFFFSYLQRYHRHFVIQTCQSWHQSSHPLLRIGMQRVEGGVFLRGGVHRGRELRRRGVRQRRGRHKWLPRGQKKSQPKNWNEEDLEWGWKIWNEGGRFGMRVENLEWGWKIWNEDGKLDWGWKIWNEGGEFGMNVENLEWRWKIWNEGGKFGMRRIWNMKYLEWWELGMSCSYFWSSTYLHIQKIERKW
jgi:hypothetical protein